MQLFKAMLLLATKMLIDPKFVHQIWRKTVLLTFLILLATGCAVGAVPVSKDLVQQFVKEQQIQPLLVQEVDGVMTAIVFRKKDNVGCALLSGGSKSISSGSLTSTATDGSLGNRAAKPVTVIDDYRYGNEVLCITINDVQLRQRAQTLNVRFPEGETLTVEVQQQEAFILTRRRKLPNSNLDIDIALHDADQHVIYQAHE